MIGLHALIAARQRVIDPTGAACDFEPDEPIMVCTGPKNEGAHAAVLIELNPGENVIC